MMMRLYNLIRIASDISDPIPDYLSDIGFQSWNDVKTSLTRELEEVDINGSYAHKYQEWDLVGKASDAFRENGFPISVRYDYGDVHYMNGTPYSSIFIEIGSDDVYEEDIGNFSCEKAASSIIKSIKNNSDSDESDSLEDSLANLMNLNAEHWRVVKRLENMSHIIRGISNNYANVRNISDTFDLIPKSQERNYFIEKLGITESDIRNLKSYREAITNATNELRNDSKSLPKYMSIVEETYNSLPKIMRGGIPDHLKGKLWVSFLK
jgi:hypothetical protein